MDLKIIEFNEEMFKDKDGGLYKYVLAQIEKPLIEYVLARTAGNQIKAAKILGINRNTLRTKIKRLGIRPEAYRG